MVGFNIKSLGTREYVIIGVVGGFILLVAIISIICLSKKIKHARKMAEWKNGLRKKHDGFEVSEIKEFDPSTKLLDDEFQEMKERLITRRINDNLADPDGNPYGSPVRFVNKVADYLVYDFDFPSVAKVLGQFKHYKMVIGNLNSDSAEASYSNPQAWDPSAKADEFNLHFVHMVGSEEKKNTPIILLHGFPSSVWEFHKSIPILQQHGYTVVAPSLPGHGFSDACQIPGISPAVIACIYNKLMIKLGYKKYIVHGGDWGAFIGKMMTYLFSENVIGYHTTLNSANSLGSRAIIETMMGSIVPSLVYSSQLETDQFQPLSTLMTRIYKQWAYFHIQSCIPDAFSYGMVDSPTALIGWYGAIYPWASTPHRAVFMGTSPVRNMDGLEEGIESFGMNNICSQLAIIWCSKNAQAAMRIYYEFFWNDLGGFSGIHIPKIPVAVSNFPHEILHLTKFVTRGTFPNLKLFSVHNRGGHFSHIDATDLVVKDITSFIAKIKKSS